MTKKNTTNAKTPSTKKVLDGEAVCAKYVAAVSRMWQDGSGTEVSYRDELTPLLRALLPGCKVINEPKSTKREKAEGKRNKPDYVIKDNGNLAVAHSPAVALRAVVAIDSIPIHILYMAAAL